MFREYFSTLDSATLPLAAMAFFVAVFAVVVVRLFVLRHRSDYERFASLPFDDSTPPPPPVIDPTSHARQVKP